jgi:seryl-tRNA synthetase
MWANLAFAMAYYEDLGYTAIDVPWVVSALASSATKPPSGTDLFVSPVTAGYLPDVDWGVLPASGEQSFVELLYSNKLAPGRYVTCTPCWRKEPLYNAFYRPYFMKVELCHYAPDVREKDVGAITRDAFGLFEQLGASPRLIYMADNSLDIEVNRIEVGSYGLRDLNSYRWAYGTGLAEPRFTEALNHKE